MSEMPSEMPGSSDRASHTSHTSGALSAPATSSTATAPEPPDAEIAVAYSFRRTRPTVLVLEDDRSILWMTTTALASQNYEAMSSSTVEDALGWIHRAAIDLIIADLHLGPGATMQRLFDAARSQRIPVIVASGDTSAETKQRAMRQGAVAFLPKPFEMEELFALAERCLSGE